MLTPLPPRNTTPVPTAGTNLPIRRRESHRLPTEPMPNLAAFRAVWDGREKRSIGQREKLEAAEP